MGWFDRVRGAFSSKGSQNQVNEQDERAMSDFPVMAYNGLDYVLTGGNSGYPDRELDSSSEFQNAINMMYKGNSFVFSVMDFRRSVFSQIDFAFKPKSSKRGQRLRPADLSYTPALDILDSPWPGADSSDLLSRMLNDVDLCGNAFVIRRGKNRLQRLRPDSVTVIFGSKKDPDNPRAMPDAEVIGYIYTPKEHPQAYEVYLPEEMCHWAPLADPEMLSMGMSWLTSIYKEVNTDNNLQNHVVGYLRNGANPGTILSFDPQVDEEKARRFLTQFQNRHQGALNSYKTLILGGGATEVSKISADLQSLSISQLTAVTESRIAEAGGVHPMLLGTEAALKHGSFNAIQAARRVFADRTMRPLWKSLVQNLSTIVDVPPGKTLWYDDTGVPFLREDTTDRIKNLQTYAIAIRQFIDAGFKPQTVIDAVISEDLDSLKHTDLYSVQLRPPLDGTENPNSFPTKSAPVDITGGNGDNKDEDESDEDEKDSGKSSDRSVLITYNQIEAQRLEHENRALKAEIENRKLKLELLKLDSPIKSRDSLPALEESNV